MRDTWINTSRRGVKTVNKSLVVLATIVEGPPLYPRPCTCFFVALDTNRAKQPSSASTPPTAHAPLWPRHTRRTLIPRPCPRVLLKVQWLPIPWYQSRIGSRRRRIGSGKQRRR